MNNNERIENLKEAKDKLNEAIDLIVDATYGTGEQLRCESYIIPHLTSWISNSVSASYNSIQDIINEFESPEGEEEEEEEPVDNVGRKIERL